MSDPASDLQAVPDFTPPSVKGYSLIEYLGRGEWTPVFRYKHDRSGAEYAFKFLDPTLKAQEQLARRGYTEEQLWNKECQGGNSRALPGLAYNSLEEADDGTLYLREEPIERFLSGRLDEEEGGKLSLEETIRIAQSFATGLKSLHTEIGIVHYDLHPGNLGYPNYGEVKISDFGTATVGKKGLEDLGHPYVRSPERFKKDEENDGSNEKDTFRPKSDVWAFGSVIYKLVTGEFFLQDELDKQENEEEARAFISGLHAGHGSWNLYVSDKLSKSGVPRPLRNLLHGCLCYEDDRINDGEELVKAVKKAERKYQRSKPMSRALRWGTGAVTAGLLAVGGLMAHQAVETQDALEVKVEEAERSRDYHDKLRVARLYALGHRTSQEWTERVDLGEIQGLYDIFGDEKTALAAYIDLAAVNVAVRESDGQVDYETLEPILELENPSIGVFVESSIVDEKEMSSEDIGLKEISDLEEKVFGDKKTAMAAYYDMGAVAQAVKISGGKTDYKTLEPILREIDDFIPIFVMNALENYIDGWAGGIGSDARKKAVEKWREAQNNLDERCNDLLREYREMEEVITNNPSYWGGSAGEITPQKSTDAHKRRHEIEMQLHYLTGESFVTLDDKLEDSDFTF
jgi:serine/threonine protein kinase